MTTPEQAAWDALRPVLTGAGLDPRRVENVVGPGHPDVDYTHGNIELKALVEMPARVTKVVRIPEFTGEQAGWLAQRWELGGLAWLMVRVHRHWFLFDGWTALRVRTGMAYEDWINEACVVYPGSGRGWGDSPSYDGAHPYSRQLSDWLRLDLDRMMPGHRARAMRLRVRASLPATAEAMGWAVEKVLRVEWGTETDGLNELLDYWNS